MIDAGDRFEAEVPRSPGGSVFFLNGPGGMENFLLDKIR
jgi:hypothetical protein